MFVLGAVMSTFLLMVNDHTLSKHSSGSSNLGKTLSMLLLPSSSIAGQDHLQWLLH